MAYRNRLINIGDALKRVDYSITNYERKIAYTIKRIDKLKSKKRWVSKTSN